MIQKLPCYIICFIGIYFIPSSLIAYGILATDTIPPTILVMPQDSVINCGFPGANSLLESWYDNYAGMIAEDDKGSVVSYLATPDIDSVILLFNANESCGNTKTVTVYFSAIDSCGNESSVFPASFSTRDNRGPTITRGAVSAFSICNENVQDTLWNWMINHGGAFAIDNCGEVTWSKFAYNDNFGNSGNGRLGIDTIPIPDGNCDWLLTVSFIVEDECENQSVTTSEFTIIDNLDPVLSEYPTDTTYGCDQLPLPNNVFGIDQCTRNPTVNYIEVENRSQDSTQCEYYNYSITRTWIVEDNCGNSASHVQVVNIIDDRGPEYILADSVTARCEDLDNPDAFFRPSIINKGCSIVQITQEDTIIGDGCDFEVLRTYTFDDLCGNIEMATQSIFVHDSTPPTLNNTLGDYLISCHEPSYLNFSEFISSRLSIHVTDECSEVYSFAAVPGSYDLMDASTYPGVDPESLTFAECGKSLPGFLIFQEVDFVFYDDCNNATYYSANYSITDSIPPIITNCPESDTLVVEEDECFAIYNLRKPQIEELCVELDTLVSRTTKSPITSSDPNNPNIPVNSVTILFDGFNSDFIEITEPGNMTVRVNNADIDEPDEYFIIVSETNDSLGRTPLANAQCGSVEFAIPLSVERLNTWLSDGEIRFEFLNHKEIINDICNTSFIEVTIDFKNSFRIDLNREIFMDGGRIREEAYLKDDQIMVSVGRHDMMEVVYDCAGNTDTCQYQLFIMDQQPPLLDCNAEITVSHRSQDCRENLKIPFHYTLSDNCLLNNKYDVWLPSREEIRPLSFSENDLGVFLAEDVFFSFPDAFLIKNVQIDAQLSVTIKADIDHGGEIFEVRGEDGTVIGFLGNIEGSNCTPITEIFTINYEYINAWAADGQIDFSFLALGSPDPINPCGSLDANGFDKQSYIQVRLQYSDASLEYKISESPDSDWEPAVILEDSILLTLDGGQNSVLVRVFDDFGNGDTCSLGVNLLDDLPPVARCQPVVIFLDPSGIEDYILQPDEVDAGSLDNCNLDSLAVFPQEFTCENLGQQVEVTLYAFDEMRNIDSCQSSVMVRVPLIEPYFDIEACNVDTLKLFANAPLAAIPNAYSFQWSGPGFSSQLENPIIPNINNANNGTYSVEVSGFNGCVTSGTVEVNIELLNTPVIENNREEICRGESILLTTKALDGEVSYAWYEGIYPNGLLLQTTEVPSYLVAPGEGEKFYYLIVQKDGCESNPSGSHRIEVLDPPNVTVFEEFVTVCAGEPIVIGTNLTGENISYQWSGPNRYNSNQQIPDTIFAATTQNEGTYKLVVSIGDCVSDTASLLVTVFPRPITPIVEGGDSFCEGSTATLTVNNLPNADLYTWYQDGIERSTTIENIYRISGVDASFSGLWTVRASAGACTSDFSSAIAVRIDEDLLVSANNNGPGCDGDSVTLSSSFVPDATYKWEGPDGFESNVQSPTIPAFPGEYSVTITTGAGCKGEAKTTVTTTSPAEITALSSNAPGCSNGEDDITFFPTIVPQGEYLYEWSGPNDYSSHHLNAVIENATEIDNGVYALTVISGNCRSEARSLSIAVVDFPKTPQITGDSAYCVEDDLRLEIENPIADAQYVWSTPQGQKFTDEPFLIINDLALEDRGNYSAAIQKGVCRSPISKSINVTVGNIQFTPIITSNSPLCLNDTLELVATFINNVTYEWSGPNNFTSNEVNPIIPEFSLEDVGSYSVAISNGGCTVISNTLSVALTSAPDPPIPIDSQIIICNDDTFINAEICLDSQTTGITYILYESTSDLEIGRGSNNCFTIDNQPGVFSDSNFFYFRSFTDGCQSPKSAPVEIIISEIPIIDAELEKNSILVCDDNPVTLHSLFGPPEVEVQWRPITAGFQISNTQGQIVDISDLQIGDNIVEYSYSTDACLDFTTGRAIITRPELPKVINDQVTLSDLNPVLIPVFNNDVISENTKISVTIAPEFGNVEIQENGLLFNPDLRIAGVFTFTYKACVAGCDALCNQAVVTVQIDETQECKPPSIITPNGDGYNDHFVIRCLANNQYPGNKLIVFNQWGSAVFEAENYDNDWKATYNGQDLPVGTYYFILDLADGTNPIIGFLVVER